MVLSYSRPVALIRAQLALFTICGFADATSRVGPADGGHNASNATSEVGTAVYHFSIQSDLSKPLNFSHKYQIVWIELSDGTHVFDIQVGA